MFQLGLMDLNLCFRVSAPTALTDESNVDTNILYERWERSNILSLSYMLQHVPRNIRGLVTSNTLVTFTFMCYIVKENIWECIIAMRDIAEKLNDLKITIPKIFLVHYILQTLPIKYDLFKVSYNTHKDEWSMTDLMTKCAQEEKGKLLVN
ncbi:unnamed protein product [Spirodela intermedia]|uniref:Uncharacterized protein n=1 Tax=Spirodela intermedia TaxID=51605 RepID=A0A7I8IEB0_SPIIN|nr:unnamed protein product [Spirodela intermedia]CAA6656128.1 unnamed protein product [Spirodela intermedia]